MAVTSYGRNKNHDDEIKKNQEKANNSLSYRCAAIKNIAGRLPENRRSRFVDLQSQKKQLWQTKKFVFSLKADMLYFE